MENQITKIGLSLLQATEAAALAAGRWAGRGDFTTPERLAALAIQSVLSQVDINGIVVIGEESQRPKAVLISGTQVGSGSGPEMDVVVDTVDGIRLLAEGLPDAISVVAFAPRGSVKDLKPSQHMEKLIITMEVGDAIGPEALDAPVDWTLRNVAHGLDKAVQDLTVYVLKRPRHETLVAELRATGARVLLRPEGDVVGAILAAMPGSGVDVLMGTGGTAEGAIAACAVKALGGTMYSRLSPQDEGERWKIAAAGLDANSIFSADDLVAGENIVIAATGITDGLLLQGVRYHANTTTTHSLVLSGRSGIRRQVYTDHPFRAGES